MITVRKIIVFFGLVGMLVSLWPTADSLYDLTGEERYTGQLLGLIHWIHTAIRPQPTLAAELVDQQLPSIVGMNTALQKEVELSKREKALRMLQEGGFHFIRQEFVWEDIEISNKNNFTDTRNLEIGAISSWDKYDNIVSLASQYEIEVIARLSNPPAWTRAAENACGDKAPPDNYQDYGDFVEKTVTRYKGKIRYYQLLNEPNTKTEWNQCDAVDPVHYTQLLCEGYHRAKAVDPDAIILSGALAQTVANVGDDLSTYRNMNDIVYLVRMYEAGAGQCFDVLSAQGYGLWSGAADQRLQPTYINVQRHKFYRDVMVHYGDAAKPIWISEAGWNSLPTEWPVQPVFGRVDEQTKGRYAGELLIRARQEWPWIGVINLWYMRDPLPDPTQQAHYFRMMDDFDPLPSWQEVTAVTTDQNQLSIQKHDLSMSRPSLFIVSLGLFFFTSLQLLLGQDERQS